VLLLRVPLQGVGLGSGVTLKTLGARTSLADNLVGLGTGLGDRLVGGLLSQREDTGGMPPPMGPPIGPPICCCMGGWPPI